MQNPVLQTVALGTQWPTLDPFLFCAHHLDAYPRGDGSLGPNVALTGRQIGQDFAGLDGWNMYHGSKVPGFPQHPHRGFETVTYVRTGWCDHADSLGSQARFGQGDVQWLTAGAGIVHSEMFPLLDESAPNPLHLFQIWLNLPAASKMVDPYFSMFWNEDLPVASEDGVEVTVIAGSLAGHEAPAPPPDSWAANPASDVAIWHVKLEAAAQWSLPAAATTDTSRVLYLFEGGQLGIADERLAAETAAVLDASAPVTLRANGDTECLILQGRPIGEPVAQYGPFVMNTEAEIKATLADYQRTGFGGWPWPADDPVHGADTRRFADHPSGRSERH